MICNPVVQKDRDTQGMSQFCTGPKWLMFWLNARHLGSLIRILNLVIFSWSEIKKVNGTSKYQISEQASMLNLSQETYNLALSRVTWKISISLWPLSMPPQPLFKRNQLSIITSKMSSVLVCPSCKCAVLSHPTNSNVFSSMALIPQTWLKPHCPLDWTWLCSSASLP